MRGRQLPHALPAGRLVSRARRRAGHGASMISGPDAAVSGEYLADRLGVGHEAVCRLAQEGVLPVAEGGRFPLRACVGAYCERLREQAAGRVAGDGAADPDGPLDLVHERALLARSQREALEMKNAALRGELLPVDDVEAVVGAAISASRAKMLAIPHKLAPQCVGLTRVVEAEVLLTAAVDEALEELLPTAALVASAADRARRCSGACPPDDAPDEA